MAKEKMNVVAKKGDKIPLKIVAGPTEQGKAVLPQSKVTKTLFGTEKGDWLPVIHAVDNTKKVDDGDERFVFKAENLDGKLRTYFTNRLVQFGEFESICPLFGLDPAKSGTDLGIEFGTDIYVYTEGRDKNNKPEMTVQVISAKAIPTVGPCKTYYNEDDNLCIILNTQTGKLVISKINKKEGRGSSLEVHGEEHDNVLGFFFSVSTKAMRDAYAEETAEYYEEIFKCSHATHTVDGVIDRMILISDCLDKNTIDKLRTEEVKKLFVPKVKEWFDSLPSFDKKKFCYKFDHAFRFDVSVIFDDGVTVDNLTAETAKFDKNALLNIIYPDIVSNVTKEYDGTIEYDDAGLPVVNNEDKRNLEFIGFKKEQTDQLIAATIEMLNQSKQNVESSKKTLDDPDFKTKCFDAECVLLPLISGANEFAVAAVKEHATEYNYLKNKYDFGLDVAHHDEASNAAIQSLASLQILSRYQVRKQFENREFENLHTFKSVMVYFAAMKRAGIVCKENGVDNYGALNAFYTFALEKIKFIADEGLSYFTNRVFNTFMIGQNQSYLSSLRIFINNSLLIENFRGLEQKDAISKMLGEISSKDTYIETMASYPMRNVMTVAKSLVGINNFIESDNERLVKSFEEENARLTKDMHLSINMEDPELDKLSATLYGELWNIRELINNNFDGIVDFCRVIEVNAAAEVEKISSRKVKGLGGYMDVGADFVAVSGVLKYIEAIAHKKIKDYDSVTGELTGEHDITTEEVKNIIMRWLLTTVTKETTCGAYNRLADEMAAVCEGMNDGSRTSENASFAASIAAMTACEEIIGGRADDGVNEDLIYAFDAPVVKTVGKDALSTVIAGLQGKEEDGTSRLNKARVDGIKTNFEISIYNARIARAVLDEVIEYSKTLTVPKE